MKWECVLCQCKICPKYSIPEEEASEDADAKKINFHVYETITKCTLHGILETNAKVCEVCQNTRTNQCKGQVYTRKHLILKNHPIGGFMHLYYLQALKKLAYHLPYVRMLGKEMCKMSRKSAFLSMPGSIQTHHDYAEHLMARFNLEIQSSHFGNSHSLSIKGCTVEHHITDVEESRESNGKNTKLVFHSHFADQLAQNAATPMLIWVLF